MSLLSLLTLVTSRVICLQETQPGVQDIKLSTREPARTSSNCLQESQPGHHQTVYKRASQDIKLLSTNTFYAPKKAQDKLSIHLDDHHEAITKLIVVWLCTIIDSRKKTYTHYMNVHLTGSQQIQVQNPGWISLQLCNCCHETYIDFSSQVTQNICLQVNLQYKL